MTKDWEPRKEEIRKLYVLEKKPLTEVMRVIEGKHGFIASLRAYRDQLKKWGYMKNRTQAFPKPKQRARPSNRSGQRSAPSLPDHEVHEMLRGGVSFPGGLSAFPALHTSHNHLNFPNPNLSSAGVPESQLNRQNQDTEVSGLFQFEQNAQDDQGKTQLHRAALDKDIEQVRVLLNAGDAVDIQDHEGNTLLHSAVAARSIEIVRLILRFGPDVDAKNHQGRAPLHLAISQPGLVTALADYGADASIQDAEGDTPLHLVLSTESSQESSTNYSYSTAEILLESGADPNKENNAEVTPFLKLLDRPYSQEKVLSTIGSFLEAGGSIRKSLPDGRTPLQVFLSRSRDNGFGIRGSENRIENTILRHFLAKEASVITPVSSGEPLILKYCQRVLQSWDLDYDLGKELFRRITPDEVKKVGNSLLLKLVADWHWQSKGGVVELVQLLLELGANPNYENLEGQTALILLLEHSLLRVGMVDMVLLLLEHGADPWHRDHNGSRAIFQAVEKYPEERISHMMLEAELRRRRSAHAFETEGRGPTESEPWHEWQEAVLAADWSESKQLMLRESRDVSTEAGKKLREGALAVLAEHHIRLKKEKSQGEASETEFHRKHVAGIIRDCRERGITLSASCTDYLVELCL